MGEVKKNKMDAYERALPNLPSLPPPLRVAFRCRDCECTWTFGIENPISFEKFYEKNKECFSCGKSNIEIDIIPLPYPPLSE